MIRFVDLTGQIYLDDELCFAWWDTISDRFMEFDECVKFVTWKEFVDAYLDSDCPYPLDRFTSLFPKRITNANNNPQ